MLLLTILMVIPVLSTIICLIAITLGLATIWNLLQKDEEENKKDNKITEAKIVEKKTETKEKTKTNKNKKNEKSK